MISFSLPVIRVMCNHGTLHVAAYFLVRVAHTLACLLFFMAILLAFSQHCFSSPIKGRFPILHNYRDTSGCFGVANSKNEKWISSASWNWQFWLRDASGTGFLCVSILHCCRVRFTKCVCVCVVCSTGCTEGCSRSLLLPCNFVDKDKPPPPLEQNWCGVDI